MGRKARPIEERLWERVVKTETCWLWMGGPNKDGYGQLTVFPSRRKPMVHRLVYEWLVGPIPDGLTIDHLCRVPNCVNPDHLEAVTMRENILRGNGGGARNARATHCAKGHPFDEVNTGVRRTGARVGSRWCRACARAGWKHYQATGQFPKVAVDIRRYPGSSDPRPNAFLETRDLSGG